MKEIRFKEDYRISTDGISNKAMKKGDTLNLPNEWADRLIALGKAESIEVELIENKIISPTKTRSRRK
jgi:hypothetical protein